MHFNVLMCNGKSYHIWARRKKTGRRGLANNKGSGQPGHPRSLISAFVIRLLEISYLDLLRSEFQFPT